MNHLRTIIDKTEIKKYFDRLKHQVYICQKHNQSRQIHFMFVKEM